MNSITAATSWRWRRARNTGNAACGLSAAARRRREIGVQAFYEYKILDRMGFACPVCVSIRGPRGTKVPWGTTPRMNSITAATSWRWRRAKNTGDFPGKPETFTNCSHGKHNSAKIIGYLNNQAKGPPNPMRFLPPKTHTRKTDRHSAVRFLYICVFRSSGHSCSR